MSLGRDVVLREGSPIAERAAFWDKIYEDHYRGPIVDRDPVTPTPESSAPSLLISNVTMLVAIYLFFLLNRH